MKQVRQGAFETNSSSMHSICVDLSASYPLPPSITFRYGEFGWGFEYFSNSESKLSYVFTALNQLMRDTDIKQIEQWFAEDKISYVFAEPEDDEYSKGGKNLGYVDHVRELIPTLDALMASKERLYRFLFSPLSFIQTGNDNADDVDRARLEIKVDYTHEEYYKGN